jgi:ATPase family associated with various cellular activities (AAA)
MTLCGEKEKVLSDCLQVHLDVARHLQRKQQQRYFSMLLEISSTLTTFGQVTKRPLYCISASELGSSPEGVDNALAQILALAQRWKAVVLLDEADVFLSQRRETDVERNALLSIFLWQLEYYQGIMFLMTNLVSQHDAAFESTCFRFFVLAFLNQSQNGLNPLHSTVPTAASCLTETDLEDIHRKGIGYLSVLDQQG